MQSQSKTSLSQAILADFVFGGIEADEARLLATERTARNGIRHFHRLDPIDPLPDQPVTLSVQVGSELSIDRLTAYVTTDGSDPAGSQGRPGNGVAVELTKMAVRWEPLVWDYVSEWRGQLPAAPDGSFVQYRIEGWRSYAEPVSIWSSEANLDRTPERPTLYGYGVDHLHTPDWAHAAIVYHVFVDRFTGVENRWLEPEEMNAFTGGGLRGVIDKLDYIAEVGANVLWLSPVFVTESYHGYDTTDYYHVDPHFGADADLVELFEQAHRRGLRVILDFVANHTSVQFAPFVAARNDPASPYRRWFTFDPAYKHGYRAFFDVAAMPQLNCDAPEVRDYLNGAAQHWLKLGADGLRLDYAAGPSHVFWSSFRAACRASRPDCWLFGEVTRAGDTLRAYTGRLDGCLDFGFCRSIRMLCAYDQPLLTLGQFVNQITNQRRFFGEDFVLPAFIDNHDMNRFLWAAGGDKQRLRLALGLLFALGGPPVLYYGTEVGLNQPRAKGPHREESRHPMLWGDAQDRDLLAYVQAWAAARRAHPSLGRGALRTLHLAVDQQHWLGEAACGSDRALIAVNLGSAPATLPLPPGEFLDLHGELASGQALLGPLEAMVFFEK